MAIRPTVECQLVDQVSGAFRVEKTIRIALAFLQRRRLHRPKRRSGNGPRRSWIARRIERFVVDVRRRVERVVEGIPFGGHGAAPTNVSNTHPLSRANAACT